MSRATGYRATIRSLIQSFGKTMLLYSYSSATVAFDDEGDATITWGSAASIVGVSSNNIKFRKLQEKLGIDRDSGERTIYVKDTVTVAQRDKLVIGSDTYEVIEVKDIDPIEDDVIIAKRIVLKKKEGY